MVAARILQWVSTHQDEDVVINRRLVPYSVIIPRKHCSSIIYSTKPHVVMHYLPSILGTSGCGLVGRYGFPDVDECTWLLKLTGRGFMLYIGDLDPIDLLVFRLLRHFLKGRIRYVGIGDTAIGVINETSLKRCKQRCSNNESETFHEFIDVLLPLTSEVGQRSFGIINDGNKIELESIGLKRAMKQNLEARIRAELHK